MAYKKKTSQNSVELKIDKQQELKQKGYFLHNEVVSFGIFGSFSEFPLPTEPAVLAFCPHVKRHQNRL
jgi:hypothetical protein